MQRPGPCSIIHEQAHLDRVTPYPPRHEDRFTLVWQVERQPVHLPCRVVEDPAVPQPPTCGRRADSDRTEIVTINRQQRIGVELLTGSLLQLSQRQVDRLSVPGYRADYQGMRPEQAGFIQAGYEW